MQQLNEAENTLLGITSGIIEVSVMQSTNYLKNASQQGLPFTLNPRVLYRGYVANCLNMGSVTGFQFFANGATKQLITGGVTRPLTPAEQIGAGFAAGSSSAILASPLELLMIQQQRKGGSMGGAAATVLSAGPATVGRGLINTAMREGIYTAGYLGVGPAVREYIVQAVSDFGPSHLPPPALPARPNPPAAAGSTATRRTRHECRRRSWGAPSPATSRTPSTRARRVCKGTSSGNAVSAAGADPSGPHPL